MQFFEIFLLSVGLAADAFAVSVCKGLSVVQMKPKHALICGVYFGSFQAFMPLIGYWIGKLAATFAASKFDDSIVATVCAIIAFITFLPFLPSRYIEIKYSLARSASIHN